MIIHLLGSNGAGKSTLVRAVMRDYFEKLPFHVEGRQKPLYYRCRPRHIMQPILTVVGHYEIECGGADTIKFWSDIADVVEKAAGRGDDVLLEGPTGREYMLRLGTSSIRPVWLQPPLTTCVAGVRERGASINAERITRSLKRCGRIAAEYEEAGYGAVPRFDKREEALYCVQSLLRR